MAMQLPDVLLHILTCKNKPWHKRRYYFLKFLISFHHYMRKMKLNGKNHLLLKPVYIFYMFTFLYLIVFQCVMFHENAATPSLDTIYDESMVWNNWATAFFCAIVVVSCTKGPWFKSRKRHFMSSWKCRDAISRNDIWRVTGSKQLR